MEETRKKVILSGIKPSGNLTLGYMAGAEYTTGREDKAAYNEPHAQELFMRGLNFAHRAAKLARRTLKVAARALQVYVQQGNVPVMRGDKPVRRRLRYKIFRCALLHSLKSS